MTLTDRVRRVSAAAAGGARDTFRSAVRLHGRRLPRTRLGLTLVGLVIACAPQLAWPIQLDELLERHVSAIGGEAALDTLRSFSITGAIRTPAASGRVQSWGRLPWEHREAIDLGPVKKVVGFDGTAAWSVDHNGFRRELSGPEKAQAAVSSAVALYRYVDSLPSPFSAQLVGEDGDDYLVSLTYDGEGEHVLHFDKDDYLLKKVVVQQFGFPTEAVFTDYRPAGDLLVAHQTVQSMGGTGLQITVTVEQVVVNEELPDSLFSAPVSQVADGRITGDGAPPDMPLIKAGSYLLVDVTLNDSLVVPFLLDSGSGATCIDTGLVSALQLTSDGEIETRGVAGAGTASFATLRSLSVPGATLSGQSVAVVDLASVREFVGSGMAGILGWDFLSRFVVRLDYRRGRMTLYDPQTFSYEGAGEVLPARVQLNVPQVEAEVDGHRGWFVLDTGNGGALMLHAPFVRSTGIMRAEESLPGSIIRGIGGAQSVKYGRIDTLTLGSYAIYDVATAFSTAEEGFLASQEVAGNVGNLVLERFTLYLDLQLERVFVEPNELLAAPPSEDLTGLVLTSRMGKIMVAEVLPGSPAESAGVRPGEFVLEVDDRVTDGMSPVEVGQWFRRPEGSRLRLKLERLGTTYEVDLTIRSFL